MKYTVLPLALVISMASVAEDGWVAVGQAPAAKPAVQSAKQTPSRNTHTPIPTPSASSSLQLELLSMVEVMQQEIAELRGTVEEQNHTIEMLKKQQQERYLDLDRRMSELMKAPAQPKAVSNSGASVGVLPADDLYASAMAAIKQKDFASALTQLDTFANHYPQHALAANAFYWSGEVQLAEGNFEAAIKQFLFVVKNHPKHNKAPDSHYKLAVAYDRNGNTAKAKEVLKQVATQYKGVSDSVVRLAERYLERLKGG